MFERFSESARLAVVLAQEETRDLGHDAIGVEHLLLGALRAGEGELAALGLGVSVEEVRGAVVERLGSGPPIPSGSLPFTAELKRVLEYAVRSALERGDAHVGPKHLLLALVDTRGVAEVLERVGAEPERARRLIAELPMLDRAPRAGARPPIDPRDPGPPITVALDQVLIGDLGHPRVDARLLLAIVLRGGRVATWLDDRGIDEAAIRDRFGELELGFEPPG